MVLIWTGSKIAEIISSEYPTTVQRFKLKTYKHNLELCKLSLLYWVLEALFMQENEMTVKKFKVSLITIPLSYFTKSNSLSLMRSLNRVVTAFKCLT